MLLNATLLWLTAMTTGALCSPATKSNPSHLDGLIDLGYAKHVPTYVNTTASGQRVAIYKNIRFARSPTGELRFRAPNTKLSRVDGVQDGKVPWRSTDCIASAPSYVPFPVNGTTWGREDCLFLDVYVPEGVRPGDKVPVLHNFYGSAYAFGNKEMFMNPMGLFDLMHKQNLGKFIVVGNNYRSVCASLRTVNTCANAAAEWAFPASPGPRTRTWTATSGCSTASPRRSGLPSTSTSLAGTGSASQPSDRAPAPASYTT